MKTLKAYFICIVSAAFALTLMSCAQESVKSETSSSNADLVSRQHVTIVYPDGAYTLTVDQRNTLQNFIDTQNTENPIGRVEVISWSDVAMPPDGPMPSDEDKALAEKRLRDITDFLKESLIVHNIRTFNMTNDQNSVARLLYKDNSELQTIFSKEGSAPPVSEDTFDAIKSEGGPSRAIVSVVLKDSPFY